MKKIAFHPLTYVYLIIILLFGQGISLAFSLLALFLHELTHILTAKKFGLTAEKLTVTPFGANLSFANSFSGTEGMIIALSAPLVNIVIAVFVIALWWIFPSTYGITKPFCNANLALGVFNLLPLFPFDGGRVLFCVAKNKNKTLKAIRVAGIVLGAIFLLVGIASIFFRPSFSAVLAGASMIYFSIFDGKTEEYRLAFDNTGFIRKLNVPYEKRNLYVHTSVKIATLRKSLRADSVYTVYVVDNALKVVRSLSGEQVNCLCLNPAFKTVGEIICDERNAL